jgi:hypothetical protein
MNNEQVAPNTGNNDGKRQSITLFHLFVTALLVAAVFFTLRHISNRAKDDDSLSPASYADLKNASSCAKEALRSIMKTENSEISNYLLMLVERDCSVNPVPRTIHQPDAREEMTMTRQRAALAQPVENAEPHPVPKWPIR